LFGYVGNQCGSSFSDIVKRDASSRSFLVQEALTLSIPMEKYFTNEAAHLSAHALVY
jgi:hypothetical protein